MTMMASMSGMWCSQKSMAIPRCWAVPVARMSMGLATLLPGNSCAFSCSAASPVRAGTFMPPFDRASVSITPGPPAWVMMAKFLPLKRGRVKMQPTVVSSSRLKQRTMPALRKRASTAESLLAMAPVWLLAARLPACDEPALMAAMRQPLRMRLVAWKRSLSGSAMFSM